MRADPDAVTLGQPHSVAHMVEVGSMETAGNVGYGDQGHQRGVVAEAIDAEPLAHVAVDDGHAAPLLLLWSRRRQGAVRWPAVPDGPQAWGENTPVPGG